MPALSDGVGSKKKSKKRVGLGVAAKLLALNLGVAAKLLALKKAVKG
jgi:hypothetical protein